MASVQAVGPDLPSGRDPVALRREAASLRLAGPDRAADAVRDLTRVPGQRTAPGPAVLLPVDRRPGVYERRVKVVLDRVCAALLLAVTLPLLGAAAAAVLVALGRPVILRQERIGQDGQPFTMHKLRTMRVSRRNAADRRADCEGQAGSVELERRMARDRRLTHKHPHDPRLVPVGRFLRRWSLDELPQLYNVLRGDMSLVGPRPELAHIVARYEPWQHHRHLVKPGITGLWQITHRGAGGQLMHECTEVDLHYVQRLSFWLDLRLLLLTVPAALGFRRGV
jgi:lipopolysaccharide/colanic/teichoic acid biosynthesis glycosyltransferase